MQTSAQLAGAGVGVAVGVGVGVGVSVGVGVGVGVTPSVVKRVVVVEPSERMKFKVIVLLSMAELKVK